MAAQGVKFARVHGRIVPIHQGTKAPVPMATRMQNKATYHAKQAKRSAFSIAAYAGVASLGSLLMGSKFGGYARPKTTLIGAGIVAGASIGAAMSGLGFFGHLAMRRSALKSARRMRKEQASRTSA